jgi:hypothetical protein
MHLMTDNALEQHAREDQPEGHGYDDQKCRGAVRGVPPVATGR